MQPFPLPASPHFLSPCSGSPADPQRARSWWEPGAALRSGIPWCLEHTIPVTPETPVWQGSWGSSEFGPGFLLLSLDPSSRVISSVPMDLNILKLMTSKFVSVAMTSPMNFDPRIRRPLDISHWGLPDTSNRSWPRWTSGFSPQFFHSHPNLILPISANPTCSIRSLHATQSLPALVVGPAIRNSPTDPEHPISADPLCLAIYPTLVQRETRPHSTMRLCRKEGERFL